MPQYKADVKYICSIYPGQLPALRRNYGSSPTNDGKGASRSTLFELKPVPRGSRPGFFTLPVYDSFESIIDVMGTSQLKKGEKAYLPRLVPVDEIVRDLVQKWAGGLIGVPVGAHPGVMEIANTSPTQDERESMETAQTLYFEFLFSEGERLYRENKFTDITDTMRLAAEWIGQKRPWSDAGVARSSNPCPFCTEIISDMAIVCPRCQRQVKEIPPALAKLSKLQAA